MIEEEYQLTNEFNTYNMNKLNLLKAESIYQDRMKALDEGREEVVRTMVGEPYY